MLRTISTKDLKGLMDRGERFTLVNVLARPAFDKEHICGSVNIDINSPDFDKTAKSTLNRDERIIVHCSGPECTASEKAGNSLLDLGFRNVERYKGGIEEWKKAGYCMEGEAKAA